MPIYVLWTPVIAQGILSCHANVSLALALTARVTGKLTQPFYWPTTVIARVISWTVPATAIYAIPMNASLPTDFQKLQADGDGSQRTISSSPFKWPLAHLHRSLLQFIAQPAKGLLRKPTVTVQIIVRHLFKCVSHLQPSLTPKEQCQADNKGKL